MSQPTCLYLVFPPKKFSCSFTFLTLLQAFIQVHFPHCIQSKFIQQVFWVASRHYTRLLRETEQTRPGSAPERRWAGSQALWNLGSGHPSWQSLFQSLPSSLSLPSSFPVLGQSIPFDYLFPATQLTVTRWARSKHLLPRRHLLCWPGRPFFSRARTLITSSFTPHPPSTCCTSPITWQLLCLRTLSVKTCTSVCAARHTQILFHWWSCCSDSTMIPPPTKGFNLRSTIGIKRVFFFFKPLLVELS